VIREQAALLACQEINAAGGVLGQKLDLLLTGDNPSPLVMNGTKSLIDAGVVAIVGGTTSEATLSMAPMTTGKVPVLAPSAASPSLDQLPGAGTWIFHIPPSNSFRGQLLADKILSLGIQTIGVIHSSDAAGSSLAEAFQARYEAQGGTLMSKVSCPNSGITSYAQYVTALFQNGIPPAVLLLTTTGTTSAIICFDIATYNPQPAPLYFSGTQGTTPDFLNNAPTSIRDGLRGVSPSAPDDANYAAFRDRYTQMTGSTPANSSVTNSYDAVYLIAYAMVAGKATTPQAVSQYVRDVSGGITPKGTPIYVNEFAKGVEILNAGGRIDYQGAGGNIDFNAKGSPTSGTFIWWQIQNGTVVTLETIPFNGD
jgi:ABC-type branched-subunit amino acid transport system substrate-binding protein